MHKEKPKRRWTPRLIVALLAVVVAWAAIAMRPRAAMQVVRPCVERLEAYVEDGEDVTFKDDME